MDDLFRCSATTITVDIICCGRRGIGKHITVLLKEIGYQKILPLVLDQPFNAQGIENLLPVTLSVFQNYSQSNQSKDSIFSICRFFLMLC